MKDKQGVAFVFLSLVCVKATEGVKFCKWMQSLALTITWRTEKRAVSAPIPMNRVISLEMMVKSNKRAH